MKNLKFIDNLSVILVLVGALCWGLIGVFNFDLIGSIFNSEDAMSPLTRIIYVLVGLSAVYRIVLWAKNRK
jgi:uncharacterized membrane protein YuzA (DUF378 family)